MNNSSGRTARASFAAFSAAHSQRTVTMELQGIDGEVFSELVRVNCLGSWFGVKLSGPLQ